MSDRAKSDNTLHQEAASLLQLNDRVQALKSIPRTGWLDRGVPDTLVESVGDHSLGVALFAWACARQMQAAGAEIDPSRVLLLALIHDLPEADFGDIPPYDLSTIPDGEDSRARREFLEQRHVRDPAASKAKHRAEDAAMTSLVTALPPPIAEDVAALWQEIREGTSVEARFVKQVDRLETYLQSLRYLYVDPTYPMASFAKEAQATIDEPLLAAIRDEARRRFEESSRSDERCRISPPSNLASEESR